MLQYMWERLFSVLWLDDMAHYLHALSLYPVFNSVHFVLTAMALRKEPGSVEFALKYPVASCVMTYIVASSGGILANILIGGPPLECVANGWNISSAVISWYLVFFSPLDICFHLCSALPIQLTLFTLEEIARAKKILSGVTAASSLYPQSVVAMAIVGLVKGSGKKWGITLYRLVYQPQLASIMELKGLSFITKVAAVMAMLYAANTQTNFCGQHQLLLLVALCLTAMRYQALLVAEKDFFNPVLNTLWDLATILSIHSPVTGDSSDFTTKTEMMGTNKHSSLLQLQKDENKSTTTRTSRNKQVLSKKKE